MLVDVSAHGSASDRNCAPASTMHLTIANRSKVERASRSTRPPCRSSLKYLPFRERHAALGIFDLRAMLHLPAKNRMIVLAYFREAKSCLRTSKNLRLEAMSSISP